MKTLKNLKFETYWLSLLCVCAQARYEPVHGYLSIVVCVLGTLFNLLNILVLTHKDLRSNPINLILTGAAEGITVCESIRRQIQNVSHMSSCTMCSSSVWTNLNKNTQIFVCVSPCFPSIHEGLRMRKKGLISVGILWNLCRCLKKFFNFHSEASEFAPRRQHTVSWIPQKQMPIYKKNLQF